MCTKFRKVNIPHMDRQVLDAIEKGLMSAKIHPGKVKVGASFLPDELVMTIKKILRDIPFKQIRNDAEILCKTLLTRQLPASDYDLRTIRDAYIANVDQKIIENTNRSTDAVNVTESAIQRVVKQRIQAWYSINYTSYVGKQYLVGRMAAEYAVLDKIFAEIANTCTGFKPHSLFDFGSGVGTVSWVARKYWQNSLQEYFCVDTSSDMNELAKLIMKNGDENAPLPVSGLYFRQFLPATIARKYSLVVSSYSLFELPSSEVRLQTVSKLWNKTEDFLIIVESGTKHGFHIVNEARDFILHMYSNTEEIDDVHIFSPCPHEFDCPLSKINEKPCNFRAPYILPPIGGNTVCKKESYSYVVFRKGRKSEENKKWPRVIASPTKRKKHTHCRLCTHFGKLTEIVFTKHKHGLTMYHCGRSLKLGDRLPVEITETEIEIDTKKNVNNSSEE